MTRWPFPRLMNVARIDLAATEVNGAEQGKRAEGRNKEMLEEKSDPEST